MQNSPPKEAVALPATGQDAFRTPSASAKAKEGVQQESVPVRMPPTGPRIRDPLPPSSPTSAISQVLILQREIRSLRDKQDAYIEDVSVARAAKRRAEEEVREERAVRKKLESDIRVLEIALSRSKRMENSALDQVKTEVEARRKAEGLVRTLKAESREAAAARVAKSSTPAASSSTATSAVNPSPTSPTIIQLLALLQSIPSFPTSGPSPSPAPSQASMELCINHVQPEAGNTGAGEV